MLSVCHGQTELRTYELLKQLRCLKTLVGSQKLLNDLFKANDIKAHIILQVFSTEY